MAPTRTEQTATALLNEQLSNAASPDIDVQRPYMVTVEITGEAALLFHRWSNEAVAEKAAAAKGKKAAAAKGKKPAIAHKAEAKYNNVAVAKLARGPVHGFGRGTAREPFAARFYDRGYEFAPAEHKIERYRAVAARALASREAFGVGIAFP